MRILIVEHDRTLARQMHALLKSSYPVVDVMQDGITGMRQVMHTPYHVAVVAADLPGHTGLDICRAVRSAGISLALLLLSHRSSVRERVLGLDSGADDYMVRPFAVEEFLARVRALARRWTVRTGNHHTIHCGQLLLNPSTQSICYGTHSITLTATEWGMLELLARHRGQVLTRQQILDHVWSHDCGVQPEVVNVYIYYLRRKFDQLGCSSQIQTVRGIGYCLHVDNR